MQSKAIGSLGFLHRDRYRGGGARKCQLHVRLRTREREKEREREAVDPRWPSDFLHHAEKSQTAQRSTIAYIDDGVFRGSHSVFVLRRNFCFLWVTEYTQVFLSIAIRSRTAGGAFMHGAYYQES